MSKNYNCERIPRKGNRLQWTGENSEAVFSRLVQHGMIGELYRDIYIQVYKDGSYSTTVNVGSWLVEGEDGKLRFYDDETHALMYRPIDDELERLRAFARDILDRDRGEDVGGDELQDVAVKYQLLDVHFPDVPCGEVCACRDNFGDKDFDVIGVECYRLAESLKEPS